MAAPRTTPETATPCWGWASGRGLKTGHTQEAGYGLVGSARQGERRVIFAFTGLGSTRARAEQAEAIVNWAFGQFAGKTVAKKGAVIAEAPVWMGAENAVGLAVKEDVTLLLPVLESREVKGEVVFTGPIEAPIATGQQIAELIIRPVGCLNIGWRWSPSRTCRAVGS